MNSGTNYVVMGISCVGMFGVIGYLFIKLGAEPALLLMGVIRGR